MEGDEKGQAIHIDLMDDAHCYEAPKGWDQNASDRGGVILATDVPPAPIR